MSLITQLEEDKMVAEAQQALDEQERLIAEGNDEIAVDEAETEQM
jgi:hypothetical protein